MAKVLRLCSGGGVVVEDSGLSIEQARNLARHLTRVGEPAGCCWCVGIWDDEEKEEEVAHQSTLFLGSEVNSALLTP